MRRYIDIITESLNEAPLADFAALGDLTTPGTLRADDLKAVQNPKWLKKLQSHFSRTPYDFNIYVYNGPEDGRIYFPNTAIEDQEGEPKAGSRRYVRNADSSALGEWAGIYSSEYFKRTFGFVPPNPDKSISIMFVENEGDGRIPFTPWMIAHRLVHAILFSTNSEVRRSRFSFYIYDAANSASGAIRRAMVEMSDILDDAMFANSGVRNRIATDFRETAKHIGKTQAMKNGLDRIGEMYVEIMAQYIVQGHVSFNTPDWMPSEFNHIIGGEMTKMTPVKFKGIAQSHAVKINNAMRNLLNASVGSIFVF